MPTQVFRGVPGGRLHDSTLTAGPDLVTPRVGRGLVLADLDNDRRLDALLVDQRGPLALFRNTTPPAGRSLVLRLEGTRSGRDAIGARVTVRAGGTSRTAWRHGGGSYLSAGDPRMFLGFGVVDSDTAKVEIAWPSGVVQVLEGIPLDSAHLIREGDEAVQPLRGYASGVSP
jgi:hypothetical protein